MNSETKEKIRQSKLGQLHPNYGKKLSTETRSKISNSKQGYNHTVETKKKISQSLSGKSRSGNLSFDKVNRIRKLWKQGINKKQLIEEYSITRSTLNDILAYRTWKKE